MRLCAEWTGAGRAQSGWMMQSGVRVRVRGGAGGRRRWAGEGAEHEWRGAAPAPSSRAPLGASGRRDPSPAPRAACAAAAPPGANPSACSSAGRPSGWSPSAWPPRRGAAADRRDRPHRTFRRASCGRRAKMAGSVESLPWKRPWKRARCECAVVPTHAAVAPRQIATRWVKLSGHGNGRVHRDAMYTPHTLANKTTT